MAQPIPFFALTTCGLEDVSAQESLRSAAHGSHRPLIAAYWAPVYRQSNAC